MIRINPMVKLYRADIAIYKAQIRKLYAALIVALDYAPNEIEANKIRAVLADIEKGGYLK